MNNQKNNQKGFTLVEVMISVGLFVIVMVSGIGAVLSANTSHKKSQDQRALIDNLSFIMEDMSRNLRLGSTYNCDINVTGNAPDPLTDDSFSSSPLIVDANDCGVGNEKVAISFEGQNGDPSLDDDQIAYIFLNGRLYKSTDNGSNFSPISPKEIKFENSSGQTLSGFTVIGSKPSPLDTLQPRVIIRLSGTITSKNVVTPFDIQTTVSQRLIDA